MSTIIAMFVDFPIGTITVIVISITSVCVFLVLRIFYTMIETFHQPILNGEGTAVGVFENDYGLLITVKIANELPYISVEKESLVKPIKKGDKVAVEYMVGSLSGRIYLTDVYKIE